MDEWKYRDNQRKAEQLRETGYTFKINADGYSVHYGDTFVGGAGVKLPRDKPIHYKHRQANVRENLNSAVIVAQRHQRENTNG